MKRMACGTAAALALVGLAACFSNPANDLNNDNFHVVQATPVVAFTKVGDSLQLRLRLVNDANNGAVTSFTISNVPAGISVRYDDKFRPYYLGGADTLSVPVDKDMQQYYVKGVTAGKFTFNVTATANPSAPPATVTINVEAKSVLLSKTTGLAAGDTLVLTLPAGAVFSQTSAVSFTTGTAVVASRAADSTSISVILGPGISGKASVTKVGVAANPVITPATITSVESITTPNVTVAPTTVSTATPAFGAPMTVTLGGGLRFLGNSTITIGGKAAYILSTSADSSTATIVPFGGSTGSISYTNIALNFLPSAALSVPGDKSVTLGAPTAQAGAGAFATAPTFTLPAVGATAVISDASPFVAGAPCNLAGGNGCRYYKIVVTSPTTATLELKWDPATTTDLGGYLINSAGTALVQSSGAADAAGNQAGGTETGSYTALPAGTYYVAIVWYNSGPQPPFFHFAIKRTS